MIINGGKLVIMIINGGKLVIMFINGGKMVIMIINSDYGGDEEKVLDDDKFLAMQLTSYKC